MLPDVTHTSLTNDHRRALKLLAELPAGLTKWLMLAQGVRAKVLQELIDVGLVDSERAFLRAGSEPPLLVVRVKITPAGRRAL